MNKPLPDLLPDTFGTVDIAAPIAILRHQGVLLSRKTKRLVEGYVRSVGPHSGFAEGLRSQEARTLYESWQQPLHLQFELNVPTLGDYSYVLFDVAHELPVYPVIVRFSLTKEDWICWNEKEFLDRVKTVFNHEETLKVIQQLLAQAQA